MKSNTYMTRALQARDPRFAQVLGKLGYERTDIQSDAPVAPASDDLATARADYEAAVGKRAFHGWSVAELREKIAAHKAG